MLSQRQRWLSWFLLTMFFFAHYFVRVAPSLMSLELMSHFSISIGQLGLISSLYFLSYTASQIPVGYLMGKFSPRNLISTAAIACALTALSFSLSSSFSVALVSLVIYAFFGSFGFVGAVSYATTQLPQYGNILVGVTQSLGMCGGFIATNWITSELNFRPWTEIIQMAATLLGAIGIIVFLLVPAEQVKTAPKKVKSTPEKKVLKSDDKHSIFWNFQTWTNSLYAGFIYFPLMVFTEGGLGPSLLASVHHLSREENAFAISMIFIAWVIGGPISGAVATKFGRTRLMKFSAIAGLITAGSAVFIPMSAMALSACLFIFGLTNTGIVGCYSIAAEMHGTQYASRSIAICNMATILIGAILGGLLPSILELTSQSQIIDGISYYAATDYQHTFGTAMLAAPLIAFLCAALTKEPSVK